MKHYNSPPSEKRPPVVVTQDGEVQECIDTDKPGANETKFSQQKQNAPDNNVNHNKHIYRSPTRLLFSSIALIAAVIAFIYVSFPMGLIPESPADETAKNNTKDIQNPIDKLKRIATFVIQDNQLNISYIESFIDEWNRLNDSVKEDFTNSFWYERFSRLLDDKIILTKTPEQVDPDNTNSYINYLIKMASLAKNEVTETIIDLPDIDKDFAEIFKAITTDIAKTEIETSTKVLDKKITRNNTRGFSESDINYLLGKYATTYEFGSTDRIMDYFSVNRSYRRQLVKSFDKVFSYSAQRHIEFSDLKWRFYKNTIIGKGNYTAKLDLKNNNGTRYIAAKIKLKMRVKNKQLRIAKLDFSNVKTHLIPSKTAKTPKPIAKNSVPKLKPNPITKIPEQPTAEELRDVVTRFINAYESGNLVALDSLFAVNAKTNDNINLNEIKQDYMSLFATTSIRRMFIKDLSWSYHNNQAQGSGKLTVSTVRKGSTKIISEYGEIQIAAKKSANKVTITHLFHNFVEK